MFPISIYFILFHKTTDCDETRKINIMFVPSVCRYVGTQHSTSFYMSDTKHTHTQTRHCASSHSHKQLNGHEHKLRPGSSFFVLWTSDGVDAFARWVAALCAVWFSLVPPTSFHIIKWNNHITTPSQLERHLFFLKKKCVKKLWIKQ